VATQSIWMMHNEYSDRFGGEAGGMMQFQGEIMATDPSDVERGDTLQLIEMGARVGFVGIALAVLLGSIGTDDAQ